MNFDTVITGGTVVREDGQYEVDVGVRDGKVAALLGRGFGDYNARDLIDASGLYVLPGLIDPHTHFGLGGDDDWRSESESAVRGGVTTVLNYVMGGSSYFEQVASEHKAAESRSYVDYGLHVVPCTPEHLQELDSYVNDLGITSFKHFMSFRGTEGAYLGVEGTDDAFLYSYLSEVARHRGAIANVHAENIEIVWKLREEVREKGTEGLEAWTESRPDFTEAEAVARAAFYATLLGAPLYLVHISAASSLSEVDLARERIARACTEGPAIYVETCPHYLTQTTSSSVGSLGKVNPPLRQAHDVEMLWEAIKSGRVDTIGSDHVARPRNLKETDIWSATAGIAGVGSILTVLLNEGVHRRDLSLERLVAVSATNAARIFGLYPRKGTLFVGSDADIVLVDRDELRVVRADTWAGNAGYNLYEGDEMKGWPTLTMIRGSVVYRDGEVSVGPGIGRYLPRKTTR